MLKFGDFLYIVNALLVPYSAVFIISRDGITVSSALCPDMVRCQQKIFKVLSEHLRLFAVRLGKF